MQKPLLLLCTCLTLLCGCQVVDWQPAISTPTSEPLADKLVLYDYEVDLPPEVLDQFTVETGIAVEYVIYESQDEAADHMRAGDVYDLVVMENRLVPMLVREGLLAPINYANVPNFKYVSADFRDLTFDPRNIYSIPYDWGTTGLLVRGDLMPRPVRSWNDVWELGEAGRVALWSGQPREMLGMALKSLGYSVNTENPAEVEQALVRLIELNDRAIFMEDEDATSSVPYLESGEAVMALGWAGDAIEGREVNPNIAYVLPVEGFMMWGDNFVIPANSPRRRTAEALINFLLRPDISARLVNLTGYATPVDGAREFILPEILSDAAVYPPPADLQTMEIIMPLSPDGDALYADVWSRYLAAKP